MIKEGTIKELKGFRLSKKIVRKWILIWINHCEHFKFQRQRKLKSNENVG